MHDRLNGDYYANFVRMLRLKHSEVIILVEGHADKQTYSTFLNSITVRFVPTGGKSNAIEAMTILETNKFAGVLCILDADFNRLLRKQNVIQNLLLTDKHDLEIMIITSSALERVSAEYCNSQKVTACKRLLLILLRDLSIPFGFLRLACIKLHYSKSVYEKINELDIDMVVDVDKLVTIANDVLKLFSSIAKLSPSDEKTLISKFEELQTNHNSSEDWEICCGHDTIKVFAYLIRRRIGKLKSKSISDKILEGAIRLSYQERDFRTTNMYKEMLSWESKNPKYKLF